jgi:hypothetical protein
MTTYIVESGRAETEPAWKDFAPQPGELNGFTEFSSMELSADSFS